MNISGISNRPSNTNLRRKTKNGLINPNNYFTA